jgi:hypothetical protein
MSARIQVQRITRRALSPVTKLKSVSICDWLGSFRGEDKILYAVYDLNFEPSSFDFCWFLSASDLERRRLGLERIHIIIVRFKLPFIHHAPPGHEDHVDEAAMLWRIDNIVVPLCTLLPTCVGHTLVASKEEVQRIVSRAKHVWPNGCSSQSMLSKFYRDVSVGMQDTGCGGPLRAPAQALRYINDWRSRHHAGKQLIIMTLRQQLGNAARNNEVDNWLSFAKTLPSDRFLPVFVPDTDQALHCPSLSGFTVFTPAAWNLPLRMALYESAYLNLCVNNGPTSLCILNSLCSYIMFKVAVPGIHLASPAYLSTLGFSQGTSPAFSTPTQKWVWQPDSLETLQREFRSMSEIIDTRAPRLGNNPWEINLT